MAKVAAPGPLPTINTLHSGEGLGGSKVAAVRKRKTISELRGEQLKRQSCVELVDESPDPLRNTNEAVDGVKKADSFKNPRYVDTRMDELFPVRKNSIRLRLLSKKQNEKHEINPVNVMENLKASTEPSHLVSEPQGRTLNPKDSFVSGAFSKDAAVHSQNEPGKCKDSTFFTVTELSSAGQKLSALSTVEMDKALKGLVSCELPTASAIFVKPSEQDGNSTLGSFCSEFCIPGRKTPLDFTLKTNMRIVSSSSVHWFHRLMSCASLNPMLQFRSEAGCSDDINVNLKAGWSSNNETFTHNSLHSWVYPQSPLPSSVVSVLASSSGGDFFSKRLLAWQDSFRSLYYMLRKSICNVFYVCTPQFVVMFTGGHTPDKSKRVCYAYLSRSTRGLRSLLKEHDVCFSMPLCNSKVEEVKTEDLVELSEIEKTNLGQTRHLVSLSNVDNNPQSLLSFCGNNNVHGLYDFLLNYRYVLTSLTGVDVPLLYSPMPFKNAALSVPEVRCKEARRAEHISFSQKDCEFQFPSSGLLYTVEIQDAYLPPWITSALCDAMGSDSVNFEASFVTEPSTVGLNVGLDVLCQNSTNSKDLGEDSSNSFVVPNTIVSPHLRAAFLKGLKYSNSTYTANLSPL